MSQITIQCRLVAPPTARQHLWTLAAEKNTPLINTLIQEVANHEEFETWRLKGKHPTKIVSEICRRLRTEAPFSGQPARFYTSAEKTVNYIFKSWFTLQSRLQRQLSRKQIWLSILKSDPELVELCGHPLETIQNKATQLLTQIEKTLADSNPEDPQSPCTNDLIRAQLFKKYHGAKTPLIRCSIAYLIKNGGKLPKSPEIPHKFAQRRRKAEIQVQRLQDQLEGRLPKGRDLTGQAWLSTLITATSTVPKDNHEQKQWNDRLLAKPCTTPFPILFETNEDLNWSKNHTGRICVRFNGLSEHTFQVYCDQRQLPWFQRFLEDQQTKHTSKNQHSSALFTLRSAHLAWQETHSNGAGWDNHYITLYCTVDVRLWTAEGTEEVHQEKAVDIAKQLTYLDQKEDLSETQAAFAQRLTSTLDRLNKPFPRPHRHRAQQHSHIIVGLSVDWEAPLTLAIWNANTQEVLVYRSLRQLLGKDYPLFLQHRQEQQKQSHNRHKAQKRNKNCQFGTSHLGEHIDRLLAKAVITIAQQYNAGSIAVPNLDNIRETLQATIDAKAEQKAPGCIEAQKRYTKQYKITIHRWSYGRLIDQIISKAKQVGLGVEEAKQPLSGNVQEKAKLVAISAYNARLIVAF
ncbi:MAG: hypothetical protein B0A82_24435 [Alkalinema sp. CACIAM 70d]|nr:MAG: hypothetical protein B0A82_24435 [Alkalinema sp. CACIAM 70d]